MTTAHEDIKFLANSRHRVDVLTRLVESPADRNTLQGELGISQPTLGRVLAGPQDRGWIEREGTSVRVTLLGREMAREFGRLEATMARSQKLNLVRSLLPVAEWCLDLERFADAEIATPTVAEPYLPLAHPARLLRDASTVRGAASGVLPEAVRASLEAVTRDGQSFGMVLTPPAVEAIRSNEVMRGHVRDLIDAGASMSRYDDEILCPVLVCDGTVLFVVVDETGVLPGNVESDDETMARRANDEIDAYRADAAPLEADLFEG